MSLQSRLVKYFASRPLQKIPKAVICDAARNSNLHATGEHTGRRLRYLETCYDVAGTAQDEPEHMKARQLLDGAHIRVTYQRNHAHYCYEPRGHTRSVDEHIADSLAWFEELA